MPKDLVLRDVTEADLPIFFEHQLDHAANHMAAFTAKDPTDREAFATHWSKILSDATVVIKTIVCDDQVVGSVLSFEEMGTPEVSFWIGPDFWGKGIATRALSAFLTHGNATRPLYARVAKDNLGSRRVLEKCGFVIVSESTGFANARNAEVEELLLELRASETHEVGGTPSPRNGDVDRGA